MSDPVTVVVPDLRGRQAFARLSGVTTVIAPAGAPLPEEARCAQVIVVGHADVDASLELIGQLPQLRLVQTLAHGTDQWDGKLPAGVELSTARGAHGGSTAEWVLAVLLAVVREIPSFIADQHQRHWNHHETGTLLGSSALVLGAGDLGVNVRNRLAPFGVGATLVGTHARDGIIDLTQARAMLPTTDVLIIVLPLTATTHHLIDAELLGALPDGAIVVNAGRGALIDPMALLAELQRGRLRAALDVTDPEPLPPEDPLWDAPGLLLTPHVGGNTTGYLDRAWSVAAERVAAFIGAQSQTQDSP